MRRHDHEEGPIHKIYGNSKTLKASDEKAIERLYRRKIPSTVIITHELCIELARISHETGIQIGLLINRAGAVEYVIAGNASGISIPKLHRMRTHPGRLQGLRLIHTHMRDGRLTSEDLTDLAKLRLDMIYAIEVSADGSPGLAYGAHLIPAQDTALWKLLDPVPTYGMDIRFDLFIRELEDEITRKQTALIAGAHEDRAILVVVTSALNEATKDIISEFQALARAAEVTVVDTAVQRRPKPDPRYVVGKGKVADLYILALAKDARLAGGIGTRGPGEAKLEIDRRRAKERMERLDREARQISRKRRLTRLRRNRHALPVISIIGYTNTGKSTLLNTLTKSKVFTADMPFATLDPSSKRLRFPKDIEVIITDTVGFIRDLPTDLKAAFMATLEELRDAHLLLEVIDLTDPHIDYRIQAVDEILKGLELQDKPRLKVFNKADKCPQGLADSLSERYGGVAVSALDSTSLIPLIERMQAYFLRE
ncbi:MAG: GTPase HflX [Desulfomonilia bacterium]